MKKINKIVAFILVFAIVITNTSIVFAKNVAVSNLHLENVSISQEEKLLKDIYNGLGTEAKQLFLEEIKGDLELQKLHKEFVDKNYSLKFNRINVSSKIGIEEGFYPKEN